MHRPFLYKRCFRCQVSPLARDFDAIWGTSETSLDSSFCLACRVHIKNTNDPEVWTKYYGDQHKQMTTKQTTWEASHRRKINLVYIPKLAGVADEYLGKWMLPPGLSTLMIQAAGTSASVYLTDGERVWYYWGFPGIHSREAIESIDKFVLMNDITVIADGLVHVVNPPVTRCAKCLRLLGSDLQILGETQCYVCQAEDEDAQATLAYGAY